MSEENSNEVVTTDKFHWSDLIRKEDWLAIWIGLIVIVISTISVLSGRFDFSALNFSKWGHGAATTLGSQLTSGTFWIKLLRTFLVTAILFSAGAVLKGQKLKDFVPAYIVLFVLAVIVRLISAEYTLNRYLEWAFFALIVGLLISNTVGVPSWLKPAVQTEYYIKAGLVIMGFSVLFSNIVKFGPYGLAIAVGAASKAKKTDLSLAVSIPIIFTVLMMVFEPLILKALGVSQLIGGALIGGTIDSTGAVPVAGTAAVSAINTVLDQYKNWAFVLVFTSIGHIIWTVFITFLSLATVATSVYIMVNGLGLVDELDFGAGAYYYTDIPEFQKYVDADYYHTSIPMIVYILLFLG